MQSSNLPSYTSTQGLKEQKLRIFVLEKDQSAHVPQHHREDFQKSGQVTEHQKNIQHVFITQNKISKFTISQDCFIEFSAKVQNLPNFLGVASDLLCKNYKFQRKQKAYTYPKVSIKNDTKQLNTIIDLAQSKNRSRQWANGRGDIEGVPRFFIGQAKRISQTYGVKLTVYEGEQLLKQGFRLVHAVGRGSKNQPAFVNLSYNGNSDSDSWVAFVGKGVCFDTGGYDIKPGIFLFLFNLADGMLNMFLDKHGATSVLSAFQTVVKLKLKVNLTCSIGLAQNFISSTAYRPSDIITSRKGLTVQIGNTDAQGRLVLCDCMNWTQQKFKVDCLLEQSTLTGAMIIALGGSHAGVYVNDQKLYQSLNNAGKQVNQLVWQMPLTDYNRNSMKGQRADLNSMSSLKGAGSGNAAAYLENFVQKGVRWAHIDIAGTSINGLDGTGYGSKLLVQFVRNYIKN